MPTIHLRIEPVFWGPVSVGTVEVIKMLRERFGLSLGEAKSNVDRCVFGGETVPITAETFEAAAAFARDAMASTSPAKIYVTVDPPAPVNDADSGATTLE